MSHKSKYLSLILKKQCQNYLTLPSLTGEKKYLEFNFCYSVVSLTQLTLTPRCQ